MRIVKLLASSPKTWLWLVATAVMVFYQAAINEHEWAQWVPDWLGLIALPFIMATTFLPLVQEARREKALVEETLQEYSVKLEGKIHTLGEAIKAGRSWEPEEAKQIRQSIIDPLPEILGKAGISNPRVCFYKAIRKEAEPGSSQKQSLIVRLDFACKAGGTQPPTDSIDRPPKQEGTTTYIDKEVSARVTLFEALDKRQPNHLLNRPNHTKESTWRSALRCPVVLDNEVYGIITVDSPKKNEAHKRYAGIVNINATMLAIAQHMIDNSPSPSLRQMQEATKNNSGDNHDRS